MKWIEIGIIEVVIKSMSKEKIDSEIHLPITDWRIDNLNDDCFSTMIENLYEDKLMIDIHSKVSYNLEDQVFSCTHSNFLSKF